MTTIYRLMILVAFMLSIAAYTHARSIPDHISLTPPVETVCHEKAFPQALPLPSMTRELQVELNTECLFHEKESAHLYRVSWQKRW